MAITVSLPTNLNFPHRGVLARDDFVNAQEASQDILAGTWTTNANTFAIEANALEENVNAKEESAVSAATDAVAASNFMGTWINQTTALGQSWEYSGVIYKVLIAGNTSPIATPSNWFALTIASQIKNTPNGNISATTVQGALNELDTEKAMVGNVPVDIHASTSKTTPVDADELGITDSESAFTLKKLTWANLKATLKTYFDTQYISSYSQTIGAFSNLKASATGLSANVTITCDEIAVENSSNAYATLRAVSLTVAGTSVGANGLDTGTLATSTWYSLWIIWNGTTAAGLMSLSATAPTLPSGYTHKARVGWVRTDSTANKYPLSFIQAGKTVQYKVATGSNLTALPSPISGVQGSFTTPTWVAGSISNYTPTTAVRIGVLIPVAAGGAMVAPNNSYGAGNSTTNPPPISANGNVSSSGWFNLESTNIYYASDTASRGAFILGWEDNL